MNTVSAELLEDLARLALFEGLSAEELESIAQSCETASFGEGEWIIRQGDIHSGLHIIVDGEVATIIDDEQRRILSKGSFFGEVALLLGEPASGSILTRTPLTCLVVPGPELEAFLVAHPKVMFRMLKTEARRLRTASEWRA